MKFITLFGKTPQHQRFSYTPRFYDPIKEEMKEREERIKTELNIEDEKRSEDDVMGYRSRIPGSFQAARKRSSPSSGVSAGVMRLGILLFLSLFIIAYISWGEVALYGLLLFVPFYIYLKLKKRRA